MMPRRVQQAVLISFICHGVFILSAHYRLSYDAYTHMLFANHYAENWFSLWETRWYTGFTVVSYPPLVHQLIALFIPVLGFDKAYALILWIVATFYPLGIFAFSRSFVGKTAASYAALASALLTPIYVTAHIFGQLPFFTSTLFALFGSASLANYLRNGRIFDLGLTVSLAMTTMASHHATLLVQPFLAMAVFVSQINRNNWRSVLVRAILFGALAGLAELFVIWPFWAWGEHQVMQTPIDHLSRHNFLADPVAFLVFFFPLYGPLIAVIPFVFRKWHYRFWGLCVAFSISFLLGLGGTTPLPKLLFGKSWEWLTYDRFAFWASLMLTPFFGVLYIRLKQRFAAKLVSESRLRNFLPTGIFFLFALTVLLVWFQPLLFPTQPAQVDLQPIAKFLNQSDHSQWRYITFGFGNQYTYLNLLTKATTIDGSYHTARTLPELRESGIAEVDTTFWIPNGLKALVPILKKSDAYGVRWAVINPQTLETIKLPSGVIRRSPFIPILENLGWVKKTTLANHIIVYENPSAILPRPSIVPATKPFIAFSWGVFPMLSLITTLSLSGLRFYPIQTERILRAIYSLAIGIIPISLCFWFYTAIAKFHQPRVYFIYTDALFFFSDAFALLAVILWALTKIIHPIRFSQHVSRFIRILTVLFILSSFSVLWSHDWQTSLYVSFHFWLLFLLILSLNDWNDAWKIAMFGLCAALGIEIIMGFIGFAFQSTAFLNSLGTEWPGILDPSRHGTSVVQLASGLRILRAYGTLPHPNILGGFAFLTLLGPASLLLANKKPNYPALILLCLGITLIGLTFSRSAWLALVAFMFILVLKSKYFERKKLFLLISAVAITGIMTLYSLKNLVFTRVSNFAIATEQNSILGRVWYIQQAMNMIRQHPLTGLGIGSFIIELARTAIAGIQIEPVHNMFLLVTAELGVVGFILIISLFISIASSIFKSKSPQAILAGATLTGLGVLSLFDHYLWTLAPGRIMLGLVLGLWAGQVTDDA